MYLFRLARFNRKFCRMQHSNLYDVAIVGGGIPGATLAKSLDKSLKICLIEPMKPKLSENLSSEFSNRVLSLSPQTHAQLNQIHVWKDLDISRVCPYDKMTVWDAADDASHSSLLSFDSKDSNNNAPAIAYIVENQNLIYALYTSLMKQHTNVDLIFENKVKSIDLPYIGVNELDSNHTHRVSDQSIEQYARLASLSFADTRIQPDIKAKLIVGADGINSLVRSSADIEYDGWDYGQVGLVSTLKHSGELSSLCAWQRFLPSGPVALLPLDYETFSLVWSISPDKAAKLKKLGSLQFCSLLNLALRLPSFELDYFFEKIDSNGKVSEGFDIVDECKWRMGEYSEQLSPLEGHELPPFIDEVLEKTRASFPLRFRKARPYIAPRVALIGDAAHVIHPLAGLGLNLGMADVKCLAETVNHAHALGQDIGDLNVLLAYNRTQMMKNLATMGAIEGLWRIFDSGFDKWRSVQWLRGLGMGAINQLPFIKNQLIKLAGNS